MRVDRDGQHYLLHVDDNGSGMTPDTLKRVGEPFFTTKDPGKGTGLGLAMILRSMTDLGGQLHCESILDQGTSFSLRFPARPTAAVGETAVVAAPDRRLEGAVLVIDDEDLVRQTLRRVIQRAGLEVLEASRGDDALERLGKLSPGDLDRLRAVILDLSLPGMTGVDVLSMIRVRWPSLPVLVLSGHVAEPELLVKATTVLQKPVGAQELVEALNRAIAS